MHIYFSHVFAIHRTQCYDSNFNEIQYKFWSLIEIFFMLIILTTQQTNKFTPDQTINTKLSVSNFCVIRLCQAMPCIDYMLLFIDVLCYEAIKQSQLYPLIQKFRCQILLTTMSKTRGTTQFQNMSRMIYGEERLLTETTITCKNLSSYLIRKKKHL